MKFLKTLTQLSLCLVLAIILTVPALAAEALTPEKRQEDLDVLYDEVLVKCHPNLFANTPETEFRTVKAEIEERLKTESDTEFLLDLMRLTALTGDSHTMVSVGNAADFRAYPFALIHRDAGWYLSAVPAENEDLLCQEISALGGRPLTEVVGAFGTLFSADNPVYLQRQFRQACNVANIYEYLGLVKAGEPLEVTFVNGKTLNLEPMNMEAMGQLKLARISDLIQGEPETAEANAYYFAKPLSGSVYYIQYNICREAEDLSMEDFAALVAKDLESGKYSRVLLDLRNNGGGSDGVIWPLFEVLRKAMDGGCELVGLIGERTFSSALINAVEIQEMGGVLAGENAGGSVCHFGAVRTFSLPNSGVRGQVSSKYIDLNTLLDAGAGRGVETLRPDVYQPQMLEDTLGGRDCVVEWLLENSAASYREEFPDAPLTRGRLIGLLYQAVGSPPADFDEPPFADSFGIEWYLPALAWAKENGIAKGGLDGTFSAARPVTWREAAVFLSRAAEALGVSNPGTNRQGPVPEALSQGWEQGAVNQAWDLGLLPGNANFTEKLTRAQGKILAEALAALNK